MMSSISGWEEERVEVMGKFGVPGENKNNERV